MSDRLRDPATQPEITANLDRAPLEVRRAASARAIYYLAPIAWGLFFIVLIAILYFFRSGIGAPQTISWILFGGYWAAWCFSVTHVIIGLISTLSSTLYTSEERSVKSFLAPTQFLLRWVNAVNRYRQKQRPFYWLISALILTTIFLLACWRRWWVEQANGTGDPTSFGWLYAFMVVVQVFGVLFTIIVLERVKPGRVESPLEMFSVFHNAVDKAVSSDRGVCSVHHIGPFAGLYEMLEKTIHVRQDGETDVVGPWVSYMRTLERLVSDGERGQETRLIIAMAQYWKSENGNRFYKGSSLFHFAQRICDVGVRVGPLVERAHIRANVIRSGLPKDESVIVTADGVIRSWYHENLFELLKLIDAGAREGCIELWCRDVSWPIDLIDWGDRELGYTFVVTPDEAYIGLPRIASGMFKFEGMRVDFQHEAIGSLERFVRTSDPTWRRVHASDLLGEILDGNISPLALSVTNPH